MPELSQHKASRRAAQSMNSPAKRGWRVNEWRAAVGIGATKTAELIRDKRIDSVMLDGARIIKTSPDDFLNSL